jgi:hypothetical protein
LKHTEAVIIECNTNTSCQSFRLEGIQLFPQSLELPTVMLERDGGVEPAFGGLIV